tara:strand:+ start:16264 stop:16755 length:492 start_codon:yes stop_codon:yes gene_type:complete
MEKLPALYSDESLTKRFQKELFKGDAWKPETELLPVSVLEGIINEVDQFTKPVDLTIIPTIVRTLAGSYPSKELNDAGIFTKALAAALKEFSEPVIKSVVEEIIKRNKFFPTVADLFLGCEAQAKTLALPKSFAQMQLSAHKQRGTIYTPEEIEIIRERNNEE